MSADADPPNVNLPQTRVVRSPSHESVTTDLSLLSLSSYGSDLSRISTLRSASRVRDEESRGTSPHALRSSRNNLKVPGEQYGVCRAPRTLIPEVLFEEESDVIRSCGALSSALGLRKSFSTGDIAAAAAAAAAGEQDLLRPSTSEVQLCGRVAVEMPPSRLDYTSRSCSTWVAVGDMSSTSQLPSPLGQPGPMGDSPAITAAEFVRSVNKKVRQSYIKRKLLTSYKALERLAQSDIALDKGPSSVEAVLSRVPKAQLSRELLRLLRKDSAADSPALGLRGTAKTLSLTVRDVERERGKPLTKYERNMMIFNWLHSLEEGSYDRLA